MSPARVSDADRIRQLEQELARTKHLLGAELAIKEFVKRLIKKRPAPLHDFREPDYQRYIQRRLEHLESLHLPIAGRTVLELGAGIGELTGFFVDRGCNVTATDARHDSLNILRSQHPDVTAQVLDLDNPAGITGIFEVVFCYGLLYHLSKPAEAIEWMSERCSGMLLLETRVSYGSQAEVNPYLEVASSPTQAAHGQGCRPTRPWVFSRLREHFPYVYVPTTQPWRPHFPTDWATMPDHDVLANAVFIGSRERLSHSLLSSELLMSQVR